MKELNDGTIRLRPFSEADIDEHLVGEDDAQIQWLSGGKSTAESVRNWIEKNREYWIKGGPVFNFAIVTTEHNKLVGMIEANTDWSNLEGVEEGDANISYGLYPFARGKGYASRAINLMLDFLKEKSIKRAIIRINPENKDSLKVPERLEFKRQGMIEEKPGERLEVFYKKLR